MLGLQRQQFDTPLTVALVSFAVAIPILVYGFMYASVKAKPVRGSVFLVALQVGAWILEAIGWLAVVVGVFGVIAHLSPLAFKASIVASILVVVLGLSGSFIGLFIYVWTQVKRQKQQGKQDTTPSTASGDAPLQTQ